MTRYYGLSIMVRVYDNPIAESKFTPNDFRILQDSSNIDEIKQAFDALIHYGDPDIDPKKILTEFLSMGRLRIMYGLITALMI